MAFENAIITKEDDKKYKLIRFFLNIIHTIKACRINGIGL